jgi:DNA adenine methylase
MISPVIKWSGSKRSQALKLVSNFPECDTYYEPFLGGGSVLYVAINTINPPNVIASDICKPLIELWKIIQEDPDKLAKSYQIYWDRLQMEGQKFFYDIRDRFNNEQRPEDLFFLTRTCVNGLIRFNRAGKFNNSFHHTRRGIHPGTLKEIILDWSKTVANVKFICSDYTKILSKASSSDFVYLDPPYFNTNGRYYGRIDYNKLINQLKYLNKKSVKYILSFDGYRGEKDYPTNLPENLFKRHWLIESGNSSFKKVMDHQSQMVLESVYLNF